jgi:hypothetical protein
MKDSGIDFSANSIIFINMRNFLPVRVVEDVLLVAQQRLI